MVSGMMVVSQPLTFAIIRIETFIIIKVLLLKYQKYKNNNKSQVKLDMVATRVLDVSQCSIMLL